ncbi:glycosyltransferase family 4 protein [Pseudoalteromonas haloplanktis]|uniref:Glycosyltransferase family 4 protein n=1 Tax=Pseudoalteromonas haloplanktis TaxID=228 RepID=A0ABU1BJG1_PSEHA|nr:glycosyltransferase family 4 protein [Pseudoalteromonas haloplanktis]MDQ9094044.1 glycosyltransferase family 4 protein [Pseudoalteromonas haloplanktis]
MKKLLYITNIPTPYRNYRFNKMSAVLSKYGIHLQVLFMNSTESDRNWLLQTEKMNYDFKIFSTKKVKKFMGMWLHFPIDLFKYISLSEESYDYLVLGGLASPAHLWISLNLKSEKNNILSVESNVESIQNRGVVAKTVKKWFIDKFEVFQVTGKKATEYIEFYSNRNTKNIITLPNVIDEALFENPEKLNANYEDIILKERQNGNQVWLLPARLIPKKGIVPFLYGLKESDNVSVLIAGVGGLEEDIKRIISDKKINVNLLGYVQSNQIPSLMMASDFLLLPSMSDPYPLSVIEASFLGVPLIVSKNIGNYQEVLTENKNGWGFTISDQSDIRRVIEQALNTTQSERLEMGKAGRINYLERFQSDKVITEYIKQIINLA